ncbi:MAG TPA: hypothetical protein V6C78_22270 [Crinalium sp.]|jgi:hypothetical protein
MPEFTFTVAIAMMIASCIFTPLAISVNNDRGIRTGAIAYIISSLAVQELNSRTRSLNRHTNGDTDRQS